MKIKDSALVAAAKLSHRYITDRFLPDKAIDLVDEAASRLAMELESVPTEIDEVQRRLMQLELAARQLAEETEEHAQERLAEIEEEMQELRNEAGRPARAVGGREARRGRRAADPQARCEQVEHEFEQLRRADQGEAIVRACPSSEADYQKLYELDKERKQDRQAAGDAPSPPQPEPAKRRLLRQRSRARTRSPRSSAPGPAFPSAA